MTKVLIFGGTVEGRILAEYGAATGLEVLVSVVSEYGRGLLKAREGLSVRQGPLDQEEMTQLVQKENPRLVLDATHPYAEMATKHIFSACEKAGVLCRRVLRQEAEELLEVFGTESGAVEWVDTPGEAVELLKENQEPVLLTTGSRELGIFAAAEHLKGRIYARVLPDSQVIAGCEGLGISGPHLIAMQGPFSVEMNCALLRLTRAGWLVTKESGHAGGFAEKLEAARACEIRTIVIRRPGQRDGISLEEAKEELRKLAGETGQKKEARLPKKPGSFRQMYLIGMGMGGGRQLTLESAEALRQCEAVFGAPRMLQDVKDWTRGKHLVSIYCAEGIKAWLKHHPQVEKAAVVYSGDTGFYSGCRRMLDELKEDESEFQVQVLPGISSMSCLCARLGRSWENLYPASLHGKDCDLEGILQKHGQVFLLLGEKDGLGKLCRRLEASGMGGVQVAVGIRMGYPDEEIFIGTGEQFTGWQGDGLAAVILEREIQNQQRKEPNLR